MTAITAAAATATAPLLKHWVNKSGIGIGTISLASKENRNALSLQTLTLLHSQLTQFFVDPAVKVVVLQSEVEKVFSSGHDLREIRELQNDMSNKSCRSELEILFRLCSDTMQAIANGPKPVIAKVDGFATAAGCQLVASCDLAYASQRSLFATPGVNIGLFCSTPGVALGRNVGRKHAMEMLLTGEFITAADAERIGLLNRVILDGDADDLDAHVDKVAQLIASKSQEAIHLGKPLFAKQMESSNSLSDAYEIASAGMVDGLLGEESKEGINAFLTKRTPEWK
jgi:enoyl-CoA hydratase/carnithine racemase